MAAGTDAKITLYTNHRCPWAHRAHIALKELGLQYDEVIIDLDKPREPWYLEINPRGLVPTLKYNDEIIPESGIVTQFLADAHPSHLLPPSNTAEGALKRARINFFVDTWFSKVNSLWFQILSKDSEEEREKLVKNHIELVRKEIEPLLKDAAPFFGGSNKVTLAEAQTASFIIRIFTLSEAGVVPKSLAEGLNSLPNFSKWAAATIKEESVTYIFDAPAIVEGTKKRIARLKAQAAEAK